jgi:hypothetical protein
VDRPQEMSSASFFFTFLGEFRLHQVAYIYFSFSFLFFFFRLPLTDFLRCLVTQKKEAIHASQWVSLSKENGAENGTEVIFNAS